MTTMLKISQFTVTEPLADRGLPGEVLVYSTRSSQAVVLAARGWAQMAQDLASGKASLAQQSVRHLVKLGLLVPDALNEQDDLLAEFDAQRWQPRRIYPIIAFTTGCNIACTYCYEDGVQARTMSPDVVDATADWLIRRIEEDGIGEMYPSLFGGEPLLYPKLLFRLMDKVNAAARRNGATVNFACSSNGLFLTPQFARDLLVRGMTQIQISLDGTKAVHDLRRGGKRGQSTFDGALEGLKVAAAVFPGTTLKVNFDRQNLAEIPPMLDEIERSGLRDSIDVKFEAIAQQFPSSKVAHDPAFVIPPDSVELADAYTRLQIAARDRGFVVSHDTAHTTPCMLTSHHGVIIGPDGAIYKCISLVGRSQAAVGSIFEDGYAAEPYGKQMDVRRKTEACFAEACPFVPVCMGGCGYEAAIRGGEVHDRFCTYPNMKRYHFQQTLLRHEAALRKRGMQPLAASCNDLA